MGYALAPNVHACEADGMIYFLDAGRDRYCRAGPSLSRQLLAQSDPTPGAAFAPLAEAGLLTLVDRESGGVELCSHPSPSGDLHQEIAARASPGWSDVAEIARLALLANWRLRRGGFLNALRWAGACPHATGSQPTPVEALARHLSRFLAARALLPASPRCLLDSLILKRWCARRGITATLVIGVRPLPFSAHCWVEHDGIVLNGSRDGVANFKPICVV